MKVGDKVRFKKCNLSSFAGVGEVVSIGRAIVTVKIKNDKFSTGYFNQIKQLSSVKKI